MSPNRLVVVILAVAFAGGARAQAAGARPTVALPAPKTDGGISVEKALKERRSMRSPTDAPLTLENLSQLCWAAQGVTDSKGHRTAPSAYATYPLEVYVLAGRVAGLAPGLYRYRPDKHDLESLAPGDRRADLDEKAVGQGWIGKAPALFVVAGVVQRSAKMGEAAPRAMWTEAGLAAQGLLLEAVSLGLGSTFVGGFKPDAARAVLGLPAGEDVLGILPVGHKP